MNDNINHPKHYSETVPGFECIEVAQHFNFCLGNVIKYVWRADAKGGIEDLKKAQWYLNREIQRLEQLEESKCLFPKDCNCDICKPVKDSPPTHNCPCNCISCMAGHHSVCPNCNAANETLRETE